MTAKPPKIYLIAGEASGDLHGANLAHELVRLLPQAMYRFWGGDLMSKELGTPVKHIKDLAFMGFVEVLLNLKTILGNISFCKKDIEAFNPDILVLIDYPGFNLRIAEWAKKKGIRVVYYISPQIWAWKQKRVYKIRESVDVMLTILPFETDFYKKFDYPVEYVGHPLLDAIEKFKAQPKEDFRKKHSLSGKRILAVLPGSRKQEISKKLPVMLEAAKNFPDYQVVIAGAPAIDASYYNSFISENCSIVFGETYSLLDNASLGIVTSGTATLETALFRVPEVVCYIGNPLSYRIAKSLIKVNYISLVNLIMDEEVVKELIQDDCNPEKITEELKKLEQGTPGRKQLEEKYDQLIKSLGTGGASKKAAEKIVAQLY
ncbi:MAG: lipid-A-disaccharide synthase [Flavobacteriia bacterium]|nr:lipid-A-disaccharide synthase [Flavobacteriia bacterium]OJX35531.1 MAG: lipid-A-disaccharide synthase [Flavobacteriia bacterium 40-80]